MCVGEGAQGERRAHAKTVARDKGAVEPSTRVAQYRCAVLEGSPSLVASIVQWQAVHLMILQVGKCREGAWRSRIETGS